MSIIKFKISLTSCKKHGLYNSSSSFLDLEKSLQEKCKYKLYLGERRDNKNIDQYRESIHRNKAYDKTSISICFDLPERVIDKYGLQEKGNSTGKKLFQNDHIFTGEAVSTQSILTEDIEVLIKKKIDITTKEALISARVGQGMFRSQVLQLWNNRCCVTGSTTVDVIRASHIKPWRHSTDEERLDPYNGIPLVASLDALFDAGLISFESSGALIVSSLLSENERNIFRVELRSLSNVPYQLTAEYLAYHRKCVFRE